MSEPYPSVEEFLKHLRKETQEPAEQLVDNHERKRLWALAAGMLIGKVVECLPQMKVEDASEARGLVEEAEALLRMTLEELQERGGNAGPKAFKLDPSLN